VLGALTVVVALLIPLMGAAPASANISGAIYTTEADCTTVNGNIYDNKEDVYLNGGPQNGTAAGLPANTTLYVKITNPSGDLLLSKTDSPQTPNTLKTDDNGRLPCTQLWGLLYKQSNGTQGYDNTDNSGGEYKVWVSTAPDFPNDDSKTDNFKVVVPPPADPLTVSKDANGAYDNTFAWDISKSVDKTTVKQIGGSATFNYTVSVSHDSGTDSNVKVSGTISVLNSNVDSSNNTVPVDINGVTDQLSDGTDCTVTNGGAQTLTQAKTDFAYSCDLSSLPQQALDNTAEVKWDEQSLDNGASLAADSADFTFSNISFAENAIDECSNVTDSYAGTLGTACVGDANPKSFTYSRTIAVPANDCQSYDNTATFTTNDTGATDSASQTVTVCGPAKTGALTIGFWKTTNGQNLIKTYCGSDPTGLGAYLRGLGGGSGPFSNATGNCSSLATYVSNTLNGASSTNMNNMLKAQMLATALDVWFSGPGWTTTKSGAIKPPSNFLSHNNLGTFNMDTTAICPMVDNTTTGTATCKNNKPSTDAVASGALTGSPMSMQAILNFAATTPSPFNGSTSSSVWYGGDRTKQEILKNVYDQFNNQDAFGTF